MASKENQPPLGSRPVFSKLSPNNKPALSRQRDHSACRNLDTPLKVRKTRENLRQQSVYADIPPPCLHSHVCESQDASPISSSITLVGAHRQSSNEEPSTPQAGTPKAFESEHCTTRPAPLATPPSESHVQRQKSVSRRMLSRVKQGIGGRSKSSQSVRPTESEASLVRRLSARRRPSREIEKRAYSFEVARASVDSIIDETPESVSFMPSTVQRSFTASTVSTAEALEDHSANNTPNYPRNEERTTPLNLSSIPSSSPRPTQTPRPPPKRELPPIPQSTQLPLQIPSVDLYVALSSSALDLHSKHDIWVAVEATVRPMSTTVDTDAAKLLATRVEAPRALGVSSPNTTNDNPGAQLAPQNICGGISSLRLCFKSLGGCTVREVIGQKTYKDLIIGQQCPLFAKIHVPRVRLRDTSTDPNHDSLFAELESIVGTLKMKILHVEARYRHTMLPSDNVVTVRHVCKIKRPQTESRWSLSGVNHNAGSSFDVHVQLAQHLAARYSTADALETLQRCIGQSAQEQPAVRHIRDTLMEKLQMHRQQHSEDLNPSVIVTDIDLDVATSVAQLSYPYSTAPITPAESGQQASPLSNPATAGSKEDRHDNVSFRDTPISAPLNLASAKPTTSIAIPSRTDDFDTSTERQANLEQFDSARQLWRHIRRTSLSTKQLEEITTKQLIGQLEPPDETLDELHRKALANKRSVGAETLKAWKWDESVDRDYRLPEAPWM